MLAFTFKRNLVKSCLNIFSSARILAQSCNRVQNSVLSPARSNTIEFVFASDVLAFPILPPHRIFLLEGVSFNNVNLVK